MKLREELLALLHRSRRAGLSPQEVVRELIAAAWGIVATAPVEDRNAVLNAMGQAARYYEEETKKTWGMG